MDFGGWGLNGCEEAPSEAQSNTNKDRLPHSHDSTGVGGHGAESSWPAGERNVACLRCWPRYILVLASETRVWTYPHACTHIEMNTPTQPHNLSAPVRLAPVFSLSTCDCQKETAILCKAQFKFILYLLERPLHFTVHLSLWLEQRLCALQGRQTQSIKVLFLEASSFSQSWKQSVMKKYVWTDVRCSDKMMLFIRWCSFLLLSWKSCSVPTFWDLNFLLCALFKDCFTQIETSEIYPSS